MSDIFDSYRVKQKLSNNLKLFFLGPIEGKRCTRFSESDDWQGTFLCHSKNAPYKLSWMNGDEQTGIEKCLKIKEPQDWGWQTKFLCNLA